MEGWGTGPPLKQSVSEKNQAKNIRYCLFLILTHFGFEPVLPTPPFKKWEKLKLIQKIFCKKTEGDGGGGGEKKGKKKTLNIFFF